MYQPIILSKVVSLGDNRITLTVSFDNGTIQVTKQFTFATYTSYDQMKKVIKEFADQLATADGVTPTVPDSGAVDLTGVTTGITQEQQELNAFLAKKSKLERLNNIKELAFLTGAKATALDTAIADLKAELHTDFKASFANYF